MIIEQEYNDYYPQEKEYIDWISAMENDIATGRLIIDNRTNIVLYKDNNEEYSPYGTVNS